MKNKRAWIKIVEAFVAILIVAGVALVVVEQGGAQKQDISSGIKDIEISVLREIQLNETLREEIVDTSGEVEWESFPILTKSKIENKTRSYLECQAKICNPGADCFLSEEQDKDVYAQAALISSSLDKFNPRMVKLFCWMI